MKVTIIPIVLGAFSTVTKRLLNGLEDLELGGRMETIQTTTLLRTARMQKRILETYGGLLKSDQLRLAGKLSYIYIQDTLVWSFNPLLRCSRCLLQSQTTGPSRTRAPQLDGLVSYSERPLERDLAPLQRCNLRIHQSQMNGLKDEEYFAISCILQFQ